MAIITAEYLRADGSPDEGKVTFELLPPALDDGNRQRTNTVVTAVLDNNGTIRVDLVPDASLLNVDGDAVYVVTEKVGGLNRSWHLLVADETEIDLNTRYPGTEQSWTGVVLPGAGGGVGIPAGGTQSQVLAKVDGTDYNVEWADPAAGGGGGTTDHSLLTNRSAANQHPTSAITGLDAALASKLEVTDLVAGTNVTLDKVGNQVTVNSSAAGGGGGHVVEDEGVALTSRSALNFIGAGVTATDNAGTDATDVTIPGGLDTSEVLGGNNISVDTTTTPGSVIINATGLLAGAMYQGEFIWESSPSTPPMQTSNAGVNNDVVPSATELYVHKLAVDNLDWSFVIQDMTADWEIYAQDLDNANSWHRWGLTGTPTLASDTWTIPVETIGGSPQGTEPNDNARIMLGFVAPQITSYNALTDKPTLGTAADNDETDFATAAQGALADTSVQQDGSGSITTITAITQSAHDALAPPDANTFYVITGP